MGKIVAWSYSRWADHDKCPQLAKFKHIDKIPVPENAAMARGSVAHKSIAEWLSNSAATFPAVADRFVALLTQLRDLAPLVEQQWGFTNQWRTTGWFAKDTWFRSVLDVCVVYDDNTADVVDFKTGKESPTHAQQAELYAVSVFVRYTQITHVTVRFWYLDSGAEVVFRFSKSDNAEMISKWEHKVAPMMNDEIFAPRPGQHCKWCDFAKSKGGPCQHG